MDMFVFDMYIHGVRGFANASPLDHVDDAELEVYGVDWEALQDDRILETRSTNNPPNEGSTSWLGRTQPPPQLSGVELDPPVAPTHDEYIQSLDLHIHHWMSGHPAASPAEIWINALALFNSIFTAA
jgi:hypothetical protein